MQLKRRELAKIIDHTNLKPCATSEDIKKLCAEAKKYGFGAVCVNPCWVALASELLLGTDIKVCAVVGFPLGANTPETKLFEARDACRNGAQELDLVLNLGALKEGNYELVKKEIASIAEQVGKVPVKLILECCYLSEEEKIKACECAKEAGARFVKTSTGFSASTARVKDIELMRNVVGPNIGVLATDISTVEQALAMLQAGATRIGTSAGVQIIEELKEQELKQRSELTQKV